MTRTSRFGVGKREGHDASDFYARFHAPQVTDDETVNPPSFVDRIVVGDARDMSEVADASVALVVTSPPYFAGKEYEAAMGEGHVPATYVEFLQQLRDVFAECVRVLEPGGRIAVNVANLGRRPYRSLAADVTTILQDDLRMLLRGEVVWVKQRGAAGNCAWGSFQQPANPVLRDLTERVVVASKGRFERAVGARERARRGLPSVSTLSRDEFMEATVDVWEIPPERASKVGHPAPFPVALPERFIHLYTYEGDLVLDPFMGSGSTAVAAARTGRHFAGYDTDPAYVEAAMQRVAAVRGDVAVRVHPGQGRRTDPVEGGWAAKDLAKVLLDDAGCTEVGDKATLMPGVQPTFRVTGPDGRRWWVEVVGGRTSSRPGAQTAELLWRAVARAAVAREADPAAGVLLLAPGLPSAAAGGRALAAVTGPGRPIAAVIDLTAPDVRETLSDALSHRPQD